jgi:hypothetical protein
LLAFGLEGMGQAPDDLGVDRAAAPGGQALVQVLRQPKLELNHLRHGPNGRSRPAGPAIIPSYRRLSYSWTSMVVRATL